MKMQLSESNSKIFRAILETLKNYKQDRKAFVQKVLTEFDKNPQNRFQALTLLKNDPQLRQIFQDSFTQCCSWEESFKFMAKQLKRVDLLQKIDIKEILLQIQPKIKLNNLHNSYVTALMIAFKKYPEVETQFVKKMKQKKIIIKEEKNQKKRTQRLAQQQSKPPQSSIPKKQQEKQTQSLPNISNKPEEKLIKDNKQGTVPQDRESLNTVQINKQKGIRKITERQKIQAMEKAKKTRQLRAQNLSKFLQSKKQFSFASRQTKQSIIKEILGNLERFMKDKMQSIIKVTKLRMTGFQSDDTGDQFRYYSNKNDKIFKNTRHIMIPEIEIRILKLRYPSKLERYFNMRVQQERQEQKLKNQIKQRMQTDKKNDKVIQKYIFADQRENNHETKQDEGPKKRERLIIPSQVIQYIIEADPWFGDMQVMQRTFYRGSA